jgi:hypothetical protein
MELEADYEWLVYTNWKGSCDFCVLKRNIKFVNGKKRQEKYFDLGETN